MIDILLAAYNGEKYISEQIESILNQTNKDWFLYIKDDCSTDNTLKIILEYENKYSDKIKVIKSEIATGSAKDNFFSMFKYSKGDYMMMCDQDDVWLPNKVEVTYKKMKETELKNSDIPILVHTDLKVVDENLYLISKSLFKMQNLNSNRNKLNNLLVQNIVTGCTVMVNRKLLSYINTIPQYAVMHDWWLALIASALGEIIFVDKFTILYRQHDGNSVGAKIVNSSNYIFQMLKSIELIKKSFIDICKQTGELLTIIGQYINESDSEMLYNISMLYKYNKFKRIITCIKYGFWKNSLVRVLGQIMFW